MMIQPLIHAKFWQIILNYRRGEGKGKTDYNYSLAAMLTNLTSVRGPWYYKYSKNFQQVAKFYFGPLSVLNL